MSIKISVIVPVYNGEKYMKLMIGDLIAQTYHNLEIIIVNDGSTDGTSAILDEEAKRDKRIKIINKPNGGAASARNVGLSASTGDYIGFADADDRIDPEMYELLAKVAEDTDSDLVACGFKSEYKEDIVLIPKHDRSYTVTNYIGREECLKSIECAENSIGTYTWNKIFKKEIIGDLRFHEDARLIDDLIFAYHFADKSSKFQKINLPFYHYRYFLGSITKASKSKVYLRDLELIHDLIEWSGDKAPECTERLIRRYLFWNSKACEAMLREYDPEIYSQIRNNISRYSDNIAKLPLRERMLVGAANHSWAQYKVVAETNLLLKKAYIKAKNR